MGKSGKAARAREIWPVPEGGLRVARGAAGTYEPRSSSGRTPGGRRCRRSRRRRTSGRSCRRPSRGDLNACQGFSSMSGEPRGKRGCRRSKAHHDTARLSNRSVYTGHVSNPVVRAKPIVRDATRAQKRGNGRRSRTARVPCSGASPARTTPRKALKDSRQTAREHIRVSAGLIRERRAVRTLGSGDVGLGGDGRSNPRRGGGGAEGERGKGQHHSSQARAGRIDKPKTVRARNRTERRTWERRLRAVAAGWLFDPFPLGRDEAVQEKVWGNRGYTGVRDSPKN